MEASIEIVPTPSEERVFPLEVRAGFADCSPSSRVRLDALARWQQEAAYRHVEDVGLATAAAWVARRTRIQITRWPRFGEDLVVRTWCTRVGRMLVERRTTVVGAGAPTSRADINAVTLWVHLDRHTRLPTPLTDAERKKYGSDGQNGPPITSKLRHPRPLDVESTTAWTFRATECDVADHVNNAAYWQTLEDEMLTSPGPEPLSLDAEIEFRTPAQPGSMRVLRDGALRRGARRWILGEDGELHASIMVNTM